MVYSILHLVKLDLSFESACYKVGSKIMSLSNSFKYRYTELQDVAEDRRLVKVVFNPVNPHLLIELELRVVNEGSITLAHMGLILSMWHYHMNGVHSSLRVRSRSTEPLP